MSGQTLKVIALLLGCLTPCACCLGQELANESNDVAVQSATSAPPTSRPADFNADIYYKNKLEFSFETAVLPINIPFAYDVFDGGNYSQNPLHYTLVPIFPSLRWQMGAVRGPGPLRGNTDLYGALDLGFRRNFVQRNWKVAPYFEIRIGAGFIDAQEPHGNSYAQGQDFTFTLITGAGFRYNFNGRYSMAIGAAYFHVSNAYLSEPKYDDNGINVCGPWIGFNMRLGKPRESSH
jgi:hypothetical protein